MAGAGVRHILLPGPWRHRDVSANGIRLHVALGERFDATRPLVVLLHGFAQFWWAWRHVLPVLDRAGWAVAALDLRGSGASDQTPRGYGAASIAGDVSGVIRSLGFGEAVLIGHDTGAYAAWATAAYAPRQVRGLAVVSAPHPADRRHRLRPMPLLRVPVLPERRIAADGAAWVGRYLRARTAQSDALAASEIDRYRATLVSWPGPRCALAPLRAAHRLDVSTDVPVLAVRGTADCVVAPAAVEATAAYARDRFDAVELPGVGHLPAEEDPAGLSGALLPWLTTLF